MLKLNKEAIRRLHLPFSNELMLAAQWMKAACRQHPAQSRPSIQGSPRVFSGSPDLWAAATLLVPCQSATEAPSFQLPLTTALTSMLHFRFQSFNFQSDSSIPACLLLSLNYLRRQAIYDELLQQPIQDTSMKFHDGIRGRKEPRSSPCSLDLRV